MLKVIVTVTLKESVLDPQGHAVRGSLHSLGFNEVEDARVGKHIELLIDSKEPQAVEQRVHDMCEKLLANTVIENYRFEVEEVHS